jgi:hypothetical protein
MYVLFVYDLSVSNSLSTETELQLICVSQVHSRRNEMLLLSTNFSLLASLSLSDPQIFYLQDKPST